MANDKFDQVFVDVIGASYTRSSSYTTTTKTPSSMSSCSESNVKYKDSYKHFTDVINKMATERAAHGGNFMETHDITLRDTAGKVVIHSTDLAQYLQFTEKFAGSIDLTGDYSINHIYCYQYGH